MTTETTQTLLLTKREAARHLRVTEKTIYNLTRSGMLPAVKFGSSVRIDRADLEQFIQQRRLAVVPKIPRSGGGVDDAK